uniref:Elongator complex protein 5 n=1 Tax=Caenorhabditis japonica TaxID=281687 RepID=A0A8R1I542_CAEJA
MYLQEHTITFASTGKPVFKLRKTPAIAEDCSLNELQITEGHSAVELPFFASKHEDGVAIRDATTKKIRIGGQVVYEPDRDDDFDDSDPDDDLNI